MSPKCLPKYKIETADSIPPTIEFKRNGSFLWHLKYVAQEETIWFKKIVTIINDNGKREINLSLIKVCPIFKLKCVKV